MEQVLDNRPISA